MAGARSQRGRRVIAVVMLGLVLGVAACGAANETSSSAGGSSESSGSSAAGSIKGRGVRAVRGKASSGAA